MDWKREISVRDLGRAAAAAGLWKLRSLRQAARRERRPLRLPTFRPRRRATGASTPRGAACRIVGLKIGASQLAAAHVVNNGSVELVQLARRPLDRGIVVGGDLRDPQALVGGLRDFFKENRLPRRDVRLGISSNRIVVRTFDLADVEGEKQ